MNTVLQYPAHELSLRSKSVRVVEASQELVADMTAWQGRCLGLAAVQIGVPVRLMMVKYGESYLFLVNPEIVKVSPQTSTMGESCLSVGRGQEFYYVARPKRVKVQYADLNGTRRTLKAESITARILQHEIDHLEGVLIIDHGRRVHKAWEA